MKIKRSIVSLLILLCFTTACLSQEIVNIVLVGKDGVTDKISKATSFIVIKHFPDNTFERLDYKVGAPLVKLRSYSDSNLTILNGDYFEYYSNGQCHIKGAYANNEPDDNWNYYDMNGKLIKYEEYEKGKLIKSELEDTIKKAKNDSTSVIDGKEADFEGGQKAWIDYLQNSIDKNVALQTKNGGKVIAFFVVDTAGHTCMIHMKKSVEFALDEEAERAIRASPVWIPAFQKGRKVKAYRLQPLTFVKQF